MDRRGNPVPVEYAASPTREMDALVGAVVVVRPASPGLARAAAPKDETLSRLVLVARDEVRPGLVSVRGALDLLAQAETVQAKDRYLLDLARSHTDRSLEVLSRCLGVSIPEA